MRFDGTLSVEEIAAWIHRSPTFVRKAMKNGSLDIGAFTEEGSRSTFYISPKLAWERLGYRRDETNDDYSADAVEYALQRSDQHSSSG